MRVAVLLPGHFRTFSLCSKSLLEHFKNVEADFFVHSWNKKGFAANGLSPIDESENVTIHDFEKYIAPRMIVLEDRRDVHIDMPKTWNPFPLSGISIDRVFYQYYKIHACDKLRQKAEELDGKKYDVVVKWRPDLLVEPLIDLNVIAAGADNEIFVPTLADPQGLQSTSSWGFVPDILMAGNSVAMTTMTTHFLEFPRMISNGSMLCAELLLRQHVNEQNLKLTLLKCGADICRG